MNSSTADNAVNIADFNPFTKNNFGINSAEIAKTQIAVFINSANHKADFVHMSIEHNLFFSGVFAFFKGYNIAQIIDF